MPEIAYEVLGGQAILLSMEVYTAHLAHMEPLMEAAETLVHEATRKWFDSEGEGSWAPLAPSTIASKAAQGAAEPSRPLYRFGNLYHSVTSRTGPYSWSMPMLNGISFGVNWAPADYLHEGTTGRTILGTRNMPARPIWPPAHSAIGLALTHEIGQLLLGGLRPAFPGAHVSRGARGRWVSLGP